MPAILIEYGFMDYEQEAMKMLDPEWYEKLAEDTCKGICKYLGITYKKATTKVEEPKEESKPAPFKQYIAKPTVDGLNCRKGAGTDYPVEAVIDTDIAITIVAEVTAKDGDTWCKAKAGYYVNKKYMKFVRYV